MKKSEAKAPTKQLTESTPGTLLRDIDTSPEKIERERLKRKFGSLYGTFGLDPELEQKGIVLRYQLDDKKYVYFRIKRAGVRNAGWRKYYNDIMKPHEDSIKDETIGEGNMAKLLAEVYGQAVILNWKGIEDHEGKEIEFNLENCIELLTFYPELFSQIITDAHDASNFREEMDATTAKNL